MSDGMTPNVDLSAAAAQLESALSGSTDSTPVDSTPAVDSAPTAPVADNSAPPVSSGGNPAWSEFLSQIPESLHESVKPVLAKWDQGVQNKLAQVQSQYAPYQDFVGRDPQELAAAVQLFQVLNQDPRRVYEQLGQHLGIGSGQGQQDDEFDLSESDETQVDPRIAQLEQQQMQMQQFLASQQAAEEQKQADAWLDQKVSSVEQSFKSRGIEPDMELIISNAALIMQQNPNADMEKIFDGAVARYEQMLQRMGAARTANNSAPPVLSPSGSVPSSGFDPNKLSKEERDNLAIQALNQALGG